MIPGMQRVLMLVLIAAATQHLDAKQFAVVIGIARYDDPGTPWLKFAAKDADLFQQYFRTKGVGLTILRDDQARATTIRETIRNVVVRQASAGDQVFLIFSGRGIATPDYDNGF